MASSNKVLLLTSWL